MIGSAVFRRGTVWTLVLSLYLGLLGPARPVLSAQERPRNSGEQPPRGEVVFRDGGESTKPLKGEVVFRGLFFGTGPVGQRFPEIWANVNSMKAQNPSRTALADQMESELMEAIASKDPGFFDRFGTALQSGDHLQISAALDEGGDILLESIKAKLNLPELGLDELNPNLGTCVFIFLFFALALAVFALVAGVLNIAIFREEFWTKRRGEPLYLYEGGYSSLQHDMFVDRVAARLRAAH